MNNITDQTDDRLGWTLQKKKNTAVHGGSRRAGGTMIAFLHHAGWKLLLLIAVAPWLAADDATVYRGPENNGIYQESGLLKAWPTQGPRLAWRTDLGGHGYAGPAVTKDMVWILSGGRLHGLNLEDGQIRQRFPLKSSKKQRNGAGRFGYLRSTPILQDGLAVVATLGADIQAIDLATGELKWNLNAWRDFGSGKGSQGWGYPSSPVRFQDRVILNPCSRDDQTPPVVAIDIRTGTTSWSAEAGTGKRYSCGDNAAAVFQHQGRWLNVNPTWRYILCLDPRDGSRLWEIPDLDVTKGSEKVLTPVYGDGFLLFDRGGLYNCIRLAPDGLSFTPVWSRSAPLQDFSHAVILDKRVYMAGNLMQTGWSGPESLNPTRGAKASAVKWPPKGPSGSPEPPSFPRGLICLDAATGAVRDILRMREKLGHVVAADGMIYAVDWESDSLRNPKQAGLMVFLIRPTTEGMEVTGRFRLPLQEQDTKLKDMEWQANIPPVIAHGRLFLRYGRPIWAYDLRPGSSTPPEKPSPPPAWGYWDLFLRGADGPGRDLLISLEVKEGTVVAGSVASLAGIPEFAVLDVTGLKIDDSILHLNLGSGNRSLFPGQVPRTILGTISATDLKVFGTVTVDGRSVPVDGHVTVKEPPPSPPSVPATKTPPAQELPVKDPSNDLSP